MEWGRSRFGGHYTGRIRRPQFAATKRARRSSRAFYDGNPPQCTSNYPRKIGAVRRSMRQEQTLFLIGFQLVASSLIQTKTTDREIYLMIHTELLVESRTVPDSRVNRNRRVEPNPNTLSRYCHAGRPPSTAGFPRLAARLLCPVVASPAAVNPPPVLSPATGPPRSPSTPACARSPRRRQAGGPGGACARCRVLGTPLASLGAQAHSAGRSLWPGRRRVAGSL